VPVPAVSVVIPCHTQKRWEQLVAAVRAARAQDPAPVEIVVVVDHNPALFHRASRELTGVTVLTNQYQRGVSGNRNTGVAHTRTELVALLDDDAYPHQGWLAGLIAPFADPSVIGTGGSIQPAWINPRPVWFPDEFLWAVGGSFTGMPDTIAPIRNVWSASMVVRRDVFTAVGGFRVGFGKVGDRPSPEDTELCLRMSAHSGGRWMYVPGAVISHPVPAERGTFTYFLTRCYSEGWGKVEMSRLLGPAKSLGAEKDYLRRTLPRAVARAVADTVRGRGAGNLAKAGAVVSGVAAAGLGGALATLRGAGA
jgi:GT2 family glycosyltransferase